MKYLVTRVLPWTALLSTFVIIPPATAQPLEASQLKQRDLIEELDDLVNSRLPSGVPRLPVELSREEVDRAARANGFPNAQYPFFSSPNACGPANSWIWHLIPNRPLGYDFAEACNNHDICYMTSSDRSNCDEKFLDDIQGSCYAIYNEAASNSPCQILATEYYSAVRERGQEPFSNAQQEQARYTAWLRVLIDIVGRYEFSGTNPNGSTYSGGICIISINGDGSIGFSQMIGSTNLQGTIQIADAGTINVIFSGSFSGNVTYTLQSDGSMIGTWGARGSSGQGSEIMLPIQ